MITGMSEILSAGIGFISASLPAIFDYYKERQKNEHELKLTELSVKQTSIDGYNNLQIEKNKNRTVELQALLQHDLSVESGNKTIACLRASVRPVITYTLFLFVIGMLVTLLVSGIKNGIPLSEMVSLLWSNMIGNIFITIVGFWFGTRAFEKSDLRSIKYGMDNEITILNVNPKKDESGELTDLITG